MEVFFKQEKKNFGFGDVFHNKVFRGDIEVANFTDEKSAREYADEVNAYEAEHPLLSEAELSAVKLISTEKKWGNHYDSGDGDFHRLQYNTCLFETPFGKMEYWSGGTIYADLGKGWGIPFYPNAPEYDKTNSRIIAFKMNGNQEFTTWWKPNTSFPPRQSYINKAQRQVLEKILEIVLSR